MPTHQAVPVLEYLCERDFSDALAVARITSIHTIDELNGWRQTGNILVTRILAEQRSPATSDIGAAAHSLSAIGQAARTLVARIVALLPDATAIDGTAAHQSNLTSRLAGATAPEVTALIDAASALSGTPFSYADLALAILTIDQMRQWSEAAAVAVFSGHAAARAAHRTDTTRSRAQVLAFALIDAYVSLTGKAVRLSRKSDGADAGAPAGPLVRFLLLLFERIREAVARHLAVQDLADAASLNPQPETVVHWVKAWRTLRNAEASAAGCTSL